MTKVYLAGGMRSEWRDRVKAECKGFIYFCPADKERSGQMSLDEYATWDLHYVRQADVVFGHMESSNPSGIGLACEIGVAYGLGKTVILVLEPNNKHTDDKYLAFLKKVANITFSQLEEAISYLQLFSGPS